MSLWARTSPLWIRLRTRFQANSTYIQEEPTVLETVIPITNADSLLQTIKIYEFANIATTSTGFKTAGTVPSNKKWTLIAYQFERTAGSSALCNAVGGQLGTLYVNYDLITATSGAGQAFRLPIPLDPNWIITVNCSTAEAASTFRLMVQVIEEDTY